MGDLKKLGDNFEMGRGGGGGLYPFTDYEQLFETVSKLKQTTLAYFSLLFFELILKKYGVLPLQIFFLGDGTINFCS